jgi:hypothetical protein
MHTYTTEKAAATYLVYVWFVLNLMCIAILPASAATVIINGTMLAAEDISVFIFNCDKRPITRNKVVTQCAISNIPLVLLK